MLREASEQEAPNHGSNSMSSRQRARAPVCCLWRRPGCPTDCFPFSLPMVALVISTWLIFCARDSHRHESEVFPYRWLPAPPQIFLLHNHESWSRRIASQDLTVIVGPRPLWGLMILFKLHLLFKDFHLKLEPQHLVLFLQLLAQTRRPANLSVLLRCGDA
eukprot:747706-Hanusia_phi.AAC.5